mmetsp:Transcript_39337/g.29052  ORF Transcript_39337/g.29052 Transcript_39337/m.29052 type:complete len:91 (-) Transcript_39337:842-1114(-)
MPVEVRKVELIRNQSSVVVVVEDLVLVDELGVGLHEDYARQDALSEPVLELEGAAQVEAGELAELFRYLLLGSALGEGEVLHVRIHTEVL